MDKQAFALVLLFLVGAPAIVPSCALPNTPRCSSIVPPDNCENSMDQTAARNFVIQYIIPRLDDINNTLSQVRQDSILTNISRSRGPYQLDNETRCERSTGDDRKKLQADCISKSVYRFKCQVPFVAEIVKVETVRMLVDEESSFAVEYQEILKDLEVLQQVKNLVSSHSPLNSCQVPENGCAEFTYTGRLELVKSISEDVYRLADDVTIALQGYYSI